MTGVDAATDTDEPTGTDPAAATPARRRAPAAWAAPGFRRLTVAWVFTNLGDSALYLMAAVWVKELTGSDVAAAFVFISLGLPALAGPFLGMLADRVSRKGLLIATNFGLVPIVLSMCLVTDPDRVWIVYAAIFAYSAAGYLTGAAQSGILRSLLRDDQLASGNGMLSTIDNGLRLVSPLIGTALYVWIGPFAVVGLTAACFAVTGVILLGLRVDDSRPAATAERRGYWTELVAGFVHLFRAPGLGVVTIAVAIAFGATGLLNVIVFPALDRIGVDPATIGVLVPLQGAGAVLGGVLSATIVTRFGEGRAAALGLLLLAIGIVPVVGSSILLVGAGMVVMGIGIPITVVAFATLRQRMTPHDLQGRAAAAGNVAVNLPQTLASVVGASVLAIVDYRWLVAITIGAVLVSAIVAFRARIESSVQASSP